MAVTMGIVVRLAVALAAAGLVLAGCASGSSAPATPPSDVTPVPTAPGPTDVPNPGGGVAPDPGGGVQPVPGGGLVDPNLDPVPVVPVPGAARIHETEPDTVAAAVDGRSVLATLVWTSGVEPCTVLAGVNADVGDHEITLTLLEGDGAGPDVACTAQAVRKTTTVDLGELEPGTWTIRAAGGEQVQVTVEG